MRRPGLLLALLFVTLALRPYAQSRVPAGKPEPGMVITQSTTVPPGTYTLASADRAHPAITIRGSNITVDFKDVVLRGAAADADPDAFTGLAVLVDGGENVTIKNLRAHGYKIGIFARGVSKLHVTRADLSYNW